MFHIILQSLPLQASFIEETELLSFVLGYRDQLRVVGAFLNGQEETPDSDDYRMTFISYAEGDSSTEDSTEDKDNLIYILGLALRAAEPTRIADYLLNNQISDLSESMKYA
jgi:hypothetical protein